MRPVLCLALLWLLTAGSIQTAEGQIRSAVGTFTPLESVARARTDAAVAGGAAFHRIDTALQVLDEEYRRHTNGVTHGGWFRSEQTGPRIRGGDRVLIDAIASGDPVQLEAELRAAGLSGASRYGRLVSGWLPLERIGALGNLASLRFARTSMLHRAAGSVTTQGDAAVGGATLRNRFGIGGAGIVVGVLSDSFDCRGGAASDLAAGDLVQVNVLAELDSCASGSDEGRAMLQIVHDVAPDSGLAFHSAGNGMAAFANGIGALRSVAGARVIVDDVQYLSEPMFQDGPITQAIDAVVRQGTAYFSAAGNSGSQSYEQAFRSSGVAGLYGRGIRHDFDPGTAVVSRLPVTIPVGATVYVMLQWNQPYASVTGSTGASSDLDLVLYTAGGTPVAASLANNVGADPSEVIGFTNAESTTDFRLSVELRSGSSPSLFKLVWTSALTLQPTAAAFATHSSTIFGHANGQAAHAVAAANYPNTPAFGTSPPTVASYSSRGGTPILFTPGGAPTYVLRSKPDFTAVDGGNNSFFGTDTDGDGHPNFYGTSAAAPLAAGVAALLLSRDPASSSARLNAQLQETATDMATAGFDTASGAGLIDAPRAAQWAVDSADRNVAGFAVDADGNLMSGGIALSAYAASGLSLGATGASGGVALAAQAAPGAAAEFSGAALAATGSAGATSITLQFAVPASNVAFSFATQSGLLVADVYAPSGTLLQTVDLQGTSVVSFTDRTLLGGTALLATQAATGRIVLRTSGADTSLRLDHLSWQPDTADASGSGDAPLPAWSLELLGAALLTRLRQRTVTRGRTRR